MISILRVGLIVFVLLISACGGGGGDPQDDATTLPRSDVRDVNRLYAYRSNSEYASVLKQCALADNNDACTLSTLPFIGQDHPDVSRSDVIDRLLVTHDWMGERFADFLDDAPDDMIELFGSVTSISIGSTVRPSFYRSDIGAIRLDPAFLWLDVEEKASVSIAEDFRSNCGRDLRFFHMFAMLQNGQRATAFHSLLDYKVRNFADIRYSLSELMFHELGHAVDYIPLASLGTLDRQLTPGQAKDELAFQRVSTRLYNDLPLNSNMLYRLAQVRFQCEEASEDLQALTASDVGIEMAGDGASEFYSYSTIREDMANLMAASMMKKHFNIDFAIGFSRKPDDVESYRCDELLMGWGTRNRLVDPLVAPRAKWVVDRVFGFRADNEQLFASGLGASSDMTPGVDWCSNVDRGLVASRTRAAQQISIEQIMSESGGPRHH
ncbi:MAG: hypothetical protein AB8B63_22165 [Granulosicoccus sp.]